MKVLAFVVMLALAVCCYAAPRSQNITITPTSKDDVIVYHKSYSAARWTFTVSGVNLDDYGEITVGVKSDITNNTHFALATGVVSIASAGRFYVDWVGANWVTNISEETKFYGDVRIANYDVPIPSLDIRLKPSANWGNESYTAPSNWDWQTNGTSVGLPRVINLSTNLTGVLSGDTLEVYASVLAGGVDTVFGRSGDIVASSNDYSAYYLGINDGGSGIYLPLVGGTMTGNITSTSTVPAITLNPSGTYGTLNTAADKILVLGNLTTGGQMWLYGPGAGGGGNIVLRHGTNDTAEIFFGDGTDTYGMFNSNGNFVAETGTDSTTVGETGNPWEIYAKEPTATNHVTTKAYVDAALSALPSAWVGIACSDETTDLTTGTAKTTFRPPIGMTLTAVYASLTTAATGSALTVDINEDGTTILSTKITIDAGELTSATAATPPVISDSAIASDSSVTADIDAIGATTAGKGLKIYFVYE